MPQLDPSSFTSQLFWLAVSITFLYVMLSGFLLPAFERLFAQLDAEIHKQEAAPKMALRTLVEDVYADVPPHLRRQYNRFIAIAERLGHATPGDGAFPLTCTCMTPILYA